MQRAVEGRPDTASTAAPTRALTGIREWLRAAPASGVLAALMVATVTVAWAVPVDLSGWAVSLRHPERVWTLLTSVVWAGSWTTMLGAVALALTIGAWAERILGTIRYLATGIASAAAGTLLLLGAYRLVAVGDVPWAEHLAAARLGTGAAVVVGALAAASARLDTLWRRRVRTVLLVTLVTVAAFGGGAGDLVGLGAALAGLAGGHLLWRGHAPQRSLIGTRQDARTIIALVVVAVTAGTLLSAWSTFPVGPLAAARFGPDPESLDAATIASLCADPATAQECAHATYVARTRGLAPVVLAALPLVLQLVLASGLRLGRRAAAIGTVVLQGLAASLATVHLFAVWAIVRLSADSAGPLGLDARGAPGPRLLVPVLMPLALAVLVLVGHRQFGVRTRPRAAHRALTTVAVTTIIALAVSLAFGTLVDEQFAPTATPALLATDFGVRLLPSGVLALFTPTLEPTTALATAIAEWSPIVVWSVAAAGLYAMLRSTPATESGPQATLTDLVRRTDAGTLGWMLTWPGRDVWLSTDGAAGVAYRAGNGVALTVTDPAATADKLRDTITGFATFATEHSLIPALYSVHDQVADVARDLGWTTVRVAEEAIIDLPTLAFTGKAFQDVRTALNRAAKEGVRAEWTTWSTCPLGRRDQIAAIGAAWVGGKALPEMGFTLGGLAELADDETRLLLALDAEGTVHAVTSWMPVHSRSTVVGLTLDVMWRREGGFRPAMEFLIARAALDAKEQGLEVLSLSGAPLAQSGQLAGPDSRLDPVMQVLGDVLEPVYGFRSLLTFKRKFGPRFEPLHLAVPDITVAPAVALALARAYLPDLNAADAARFAQKLVTRD